MTELFIELVSSPLEYPNATGGTLLRRHLLRASPAIRLSNSTGSTSPKYFAWCLSATILRGFSADEIDVNDPFFLITCTLNLPAASVLIIFSATLAVSDSNPSLFVLRRDSKTIFRKCEIDVCRSTLFFFWFLSWIEFVSAILSRRTL